MLNYVWELAQAPLYVGLKTYNAGVFWHWFVASLGDGVMVLIIFAAGWIALHRWDWFQRRGVAGYLVMLIAGFILGIFVEWLGVHILERWAYTGAMPTIPRIGIGLVPIAQMLVLPPLVFRTVGFLGWKT